MRIRHDRKLRYRDPGAWALAAALLLVAACRDDGDPNVFVTLKLGAPELEGRVTALRVNATTLSKVYSDVYQGPTGLPLSFPTTFSFSLPRPEQGLLDLDILGVDAGGRSVASASARELRVRAGSTLKVEAFLRCLGSCPVPMPDAGLPADGPPPPDEGSCGNGRVDRGETCDLAIAAGLPGACPANECNDGLSCTRDLKVGSGCTANCLHQEITEFKPGDGCCPTNGTQATDEDCSSTCGNGVVDPREVCDLAIAAGLPGACPGVQDCADADSCTLDRLISANTCSARCAHQAIASVANGDGCCPGVAATGTDTDCQPTCGNGLKEADEMCDVGVPAGRADACPRACDDGQACTVDRLVGTGCNVRCEFSPVTELLAGDGCCPAGATALADPDCAPSCGDGVVEPGETCDRGLAAGQPGACATTCPVPSDACLTATLVGGADRCNAVCELTSITNCRPSSDGCCPTGCTSASDPDCSPSCANGTVEGNERCDVALSSPTPGSCPTACSDDDPCTDDLLVSGNTCEAHCVFVPVTAFRSGDMCCPPGANRAVDADCAASCGNGVVEPPRETCDRAIAPGKPGGCLSACPAPGACSSVRASGSAETCTTRCERVAITACDGSDGCCPSGCTAAIDADCPSVCGNGVLDPGEACDRAITAGNPGACPAACDDGRSCTQELPTGSIENCTRRCTSNPLTACAGGDGCCPVGCQFTTDPDCAPICGNGTVEDGETCDPPASCPTSCKDDGDACTFTRLVGQPTACTARCTHTPILVCSPESDHCCPSMCRMPGSDVDCPVASVPGPMSQGM